jgi:acetyl esterase/lipase
MPIDPVIARRLPLLEGIASFPEALADPEQKARLDAFMDPGEQPPSPPVTVRDDAAPGPHGPIPVRVYRPADGSAGSDGSDGSDAGDSADAPRPALVWMHGGAFMGGDLDMPEADTVARELAHRAGAVVVSVDYRLAVGGVTYPVPHDDVVAAFRWVVAQAGTLGVDPDDVSLGGASAGANLAAGAGLRLRDDADRPGPRRLLLAYPCVHAVLPPASDELAEKMTEVPRLLRFLQEDRDWITGNYLGGLDVEVPGYAMPALAADLTGLPPVTIVNSEYDDLRTSGETFAAMLRDAGVPVDVRTEPGTLHGHLNHAPSALVGADRTLAVFADALRVRSTAGQPA